MEIKGIIALIKTEGRTDKFVRQQLPNDYFLALKITQIDDQEISTLASAFEALKSKFPSIKVGDEEVNDLFETYKLAPGMEDACHLSLAYFPDFRKGRSTDNELDQDKVDHASEDLAGIGLTIEINGCPFEIVSTSENSQHIETEASIAKAPFIGKGRDSIINLSPDKATQDRLTEILTPVFGEGYKIKNSRGDVVPFHITIAQTDKLNATLDAKASNDSKLAERAEVSSLSF